MNSKKNPNLLHVGPKLTHYSKQIHILCMLGAYNEFRLFDTCEN